MTDDQKQLATMIIIWAAVGLFGTLLAWLGERTKNAFFVQLGKALKGLFLDSRQVLEARAVGLAVPVIAVLVALLSGCSQQPPDVPGALVNPRDMPITMRFGERVELKQRALIYSAADDWSRATGGAVRVDISDAGTVDIDVQSGGPLGRCTSMQMLLRSGEPDALFRAAALHELGHKFGLKHLPAGVMMSHIGPEQNCIDDTALRVACSAYRCANPKETCL